MASGMRILLIGSGAREHALAWRLAMDPAVRHVYVAPGNGGIDGLKATCLAARAGSDWLREAKDRKVDLTVVGPEKPLVAGLVDTFLDAGLPILGPTAAAARIEGSKVFAKG